MLGRRACLWQCIRAIEPSHNGPCHVGRNAVRLLHSSPHRTFPAASQKVVRRIGAAPRPGSVTEVEKLYGSKRDPWSLSPLTVSRKEKEREILKRPRQSHTPAEKPNRSGLVSRNYGQRDPEMTISDWNRRKAELLHLRDPLELAGFVKEQLQKGRDKEALQLVRMASHEMKCVVSWNHIIDHRLAKGRVSQGVKIYNEMKKRAQFPDTYTYGILLRGLTINAHESGALEKALSIYHSMSAPNSRVSPSIIHTNSLLMVCARAGDLDTLWGIAAKIPDKGPASASARTYVIILNAMRHSLLLDGPKDETKEEEARRKEQSILEGKKLWNEIVHKWRQGDIAVEEDLVCAMGRLLLLGARPSDWDDVLSLIEQTMNIPRGVPRLGTKARLDAGFQQLRAPHVLPDFRFDDRHLAPKGDTILPSEEQAPFAALGLDTGLSKATSTPVMYAKPSNNTLSLVLEACQAIVAAKAGVYYWDILTDPNKYRVVPDVNNLNCLLRLLRQARSSAKVVDLLQTDLAKGLKLPRGTFRIALSTCVRDKNNPNSLRHAGQILEMMSQRLEDADPKVVQMFAQLAIHFPSATGADLIESILRLQPLINSIRLQLGIGGQRRGSNQIGATYLTGAEREAAIDALRSIFGLHDKLINSDLVSEEDKRPVKESRARLSAFLHRLRFKEKAPKLKWSENSTESGSESEGLEKPNSAEEDIEDALSGHVSGHESGARQGYAPGETSEQLSSVTTSNTSARHSV